VLAQRERVYTTFDRTTMARADFKLRVQPDDADVRERVLDFLVANPHHCSERCVALDLGEAADGGRRMAIVQSGAYDVFVLKPGAALVRAPGVETAPPTLEAKSSVEVSEARVIRIDGKPVGPPLD
jgi:hypothetical protein